MTSHLPLIISVLLPACSGNLNWRLDNGFDEPERDAAFRSAATQWCQAAELCAEIGGDGANVVQIDPELDRDYAGYYDPDADGATISVQPWLDGDELLPVLLHELGHHWGCEDTDNADSIMYFSVEGRAKRISPGDAECAR